MAPEAISLIAKLFAGPTRAAGRGAPAAADAAGEAIGAAPAVGGQDDRPEARFERRLDRALEGDARDQADGGRSDVARPESGGGPDARRSRLEQDGDNRAAPRDGAAPASDDPAASEQAADDTARHAAGPGAGALAIENEYQYNV